MNKTITILVAALLVSAVGSTVFAGNSGVSDPTVTVTQFTTPDGLRDKTHESLDSLDTAIESTIDVLDGVLDANGNLDAVDVVGEITVAASNDLSAVTDDSSATNAIVSNGVVDGEHLLDNSVDDDSLDFTDITGADLTLTDCGAVAGSTLTSATILTLTDLPAADGAAIVIDANAAGASTNYFLELGATITVGDDGDGTLIETNTAAAAEYGLRCLINGATYFILMEKE